MMLEEVIEYVGFGIFGAKVCVGNADRFVFCLVHTVFKHNMITVVLQKDRKAPCGAFILMLVIF